MKRRFPVVKLVLFVSVLFLVLALSWGMWRGKSWILGEVVEVLREEAAKACEGCTIDFDSLSFSFVSLTAVAERAQLVRNGHVAFQVERVTASVSLRRIWQREIVLEDLLLENADIFGISDESPTYRFIDALTAARPVDDPEPWIKVYFMGLTLRDARFTENFTATKLHGSDISLQVSRTAEDNFLLIPKIPRLELSVSGKQGTRRLFLGSVTGRLTIRDNDVVFHKVEIQREDGWARAFGKSFTLEGNRLQATMESNFDTPSVDFDDLLLGAFFGVGDITGTLARPQAEGEILLKDSMQAAFVLNGQQLVHFDKLSSKFRFDMRDKRPLVDAYAISGGGPGVSVRRGSSFMLDDDAFGGGLNLTVDQLSFAGFDMSGVTVRLDFLGTLSRPEVKAKLQGETLRYLGYSVGPATVLLTYSDEQVAITAETAAQSEQGMLSAEGTINLAADVPQLNSLSLVYDSLRIEGPTEGHVARDFVVSGHGKLEGPLRLESIKGQFEIEGGYAPLWSALNGGKLRMFEFVRGEVFLNDAKIRVDVQNEKRNFTFNTLIDLLKRAPSEASVKVTQWAPQEIAADQYCLNLGFEASYKYDFQNPLYGNGKLLIDEATAGCQIFKVELVAPQSTMEIKNGELLFDEVLLRGAETALELEGLISIPKGYALHALGHVELGGFAGLFPKLDNLDGGLTVALEVTGPLGEIGLEGRADIEQGEIGVVEADFSALDIQGQVILQGRKFRVEKLTGLVNGGVFSLEGEVVPFDLFSSHLRVQFQDALLTNWKDVSLALSGDLTLARGVSGRPLIEGSIDISGAELEKNFDIRELLRLFESFFSSDSATVPSRALTLPDIDLALAVGASNNLLVNSNWLQTELRADVTVRGSLAAPIFTGKLETLSGWFGLRNRRFDITAGILRFTPGRYLPELDIIAESTVRSRTGETVGVIMELTGPLEAPVVALSSDRGLSQQELIRLLASSQGGVLTDTSSGLGLGLEYRGFALGTQEESTILESLLYELTHLDNLSLEPAYNSLTGALEPSIFAEKRLNDWISLTGRGLLTQNFSQSDASLNFQLTNALAASGSVRSQSSQDEIALEGNLRYVIFTSLQQLLTVDIEGNRHFGKQEIKRAARLQENSRIYVTDTGRLTHELFQAYRDAGYFNAQVNVSCRQVVGQCSELSIKVEEGQRSKVEAVHIEGGLPEQLENHEVVKNLQQQAYATENYRKRAERSLIRLLRSEGYISARVSAHFEHIADSPGKVLVLRVRSGKPVSFFFEGNTRFTNEELLQTINLFGRAQPFGNNSISVLIQNIERLYRQDGYLYVTIRSTESLESKTLRKLYQITIDEGPQIKVREVSFEGTEKFTQEHVRSWLESSGVPVDKVFNPEFAVEEEIENIRFQIAEQYRHRGFNDVVVESTVVPLPNEDQVDIVYSIQEGQQQAYSSIRIKGLPTGITWEPQVTKLVAAPQLNSTVQDLYTLLRDEGYLEAEVWSEVEYQNNDQSRVILHVTAGKQTTIRTITIEGAYSTNEEVIKNALPIRPGAPWRRHLLDETRRVLFRLGLFARVEMVARDGKMNASQEDLVIIVKERSLTSLEVGTGVNSVFGIHLFSEALDRSIFADGRTLSLRLDAYYHAQNQEISQGIANFAYTNPQFLGLDLVHVEDVSFQRITQLNQEYELARVALGSFFYVPAYDVFSFSFGHTLDLEDVSEVSPDAILSELDTGSVRLSFLSGSFTLDKRDDALNPRSGFALKADYKLAHEAYASEANFGTLDTKASYLMPLGILGKRFSLALSSRYGYSRTFGGTEAIPITQRFYLGGRNTVRGFRENSLGARGDFGSVIGGDILQANSAELRYTLTDNSTVHVFVDSGNVFLRERHVDLDNQRVSTGIGIRYLSPIGPVGFDIGKPLDEREGEPSLRFHFAIGSNF